MNQLAVLVHSALWIPKKHETHENLICVLNVGCEKKELSGSYQNDWKLFFDFTKYNDIFQEVMANPKSDSMPKIILLQAAKRSFPRRYF